MKALIIIVALVAVSFVGLLVYERNRDEQPARACERISNPNSDKPALPDDWCPPDFAAATASLQANFAPTLGYKPPKLLSNSALVDGPFPVGASPKKGKEPNPRNVRMARIKLIKGATARLAESENKLCLCMPGTPLPDIMLDGDVCGRNWTSQHRNRLCSPDDRDESGVLPIEEDGGTIVLKAGPPATVSIE